MTRNKLDPPLCQWWLKRVDPVIHWFLSISFAAEALIGLLTGRPLPALMSLVVAIGLFPPVQTPPALNMLLILLGLLIIAV